MNLKSICTAIAIAVVSCSALFADPLTLAGKVVSVTEKTLVIMSGKETWTIERNADTTVSGKLEVGAIVTVNTTTTSGHKNE